MDRRVLTRTNVPPWRHLNILNPTLTPLQQCLEPIMLALLEDSFSRRIDVRACVTSHSLVDDLCMRLGQQEQKLLRKGER